MLSLADIFVLLLLSSLAAWWWRGRGIGECALHYARQHCQRLDIELLDGNVALQGLSWQRDSQGRWRLARRYAFEFTVTGEQRLHGRLTLSMVANWRVSNWMRIPSIQPARRAARSSRWMTGGAATRVSISARPTDQRASSRKARTRAALSSGNSCMKQCPPATTWALTCALPAHQRATERATKG